jgi:hypothetical protein
MTEGVEIRDALEARAMALHMKDHPAKNWTEEFQNSPIGDEEDENLQSDEDIHSYMREQEAKLREQAAVNEDDDLIGLRLRLYVCLLYDAGY